MLEGAVMEYAKWFIGMISIMFISVAVIFMFKLNEVNSFQQEVNYQIERHGGLTNAVVYETTDVLLPLPHTHSDGTVAQSYSDVNMNDATLNGYVRKGAIPELNELAKKNYGGPLVASDTQGATPLFPEERGTDVETSGIFVQEYKELVDAKGKVKMQYNVRTINEQARYGTPIKYVITRQIGNIEGSSFFKPAIIGESASRVRGVASE